MKKGCISSGLGIGAIIENKNGDILVVEEKDTKSAYSKFKGDISIPFGTVGDNNKDEGFVDALYREVLEETGLDLNENKYLPCEFLNGELRNVQGDLLFSVKLFHIKLNGVLKKYEEQILNEEIENAYFISKRDFEEKIEKGGIRAGADIFYLKFISILEMVDNNRFSGLERFFLEKTLGGDNIIVVGPGSAYDLNKDVGKT